MRSPATLGVLLSLLTACGPNTDLTVPPPPTPEAAVVADVTPPLATGRLVDWLKPTRYALALQIDPSAERFSGEVSIDVTLDRPTRSFVLHASELEVTRAEVIVDGRARPATTFTRRAVGSPGPEEELVLVVATPVEASTAELRIRYDAKLGAALRGAYRVAAGGRDFVFTQFEPSDARRVFPCFDDPAYKVPFAVEIAVPKGNIAVANAPEKRRSPDGDRVVFTFETTQRMPTYLVAFAVGPLEITEGAKTPVPIRVVSTPGGGKLAGAALTMAAEQLAVLSDYFGSPYPYEKLDLVAVPNFGAGAMENAGLITFREEYLLFDEATVSAKTKRDAAMTIAHELAHHWFGNLVTMEWWDDLWLNEGFATFMESAIVDRYKPEMRAHLELLSLTGWVMNVDALGSARAVRNEVTNTYQAEEAFDGITYVKGAAFLRMLESWLGESSFRAGVHAYLSEHAWGNATAADLFRALSRTSERKVEVVAATFLDEPGVPLVRAELTCSDGAPPRLSLRQRQYSGIANAPRSSRQWTIPVCVEHGRKGQKVPDRDCLLLGEATAELPLGVTSCPAWVLPNAAYAGYYRFALPGDELTALARQTLGASALENIGFITNLWSLVQSGDVEAALLFDTLKAYKAELRREVVEEVIKVLERADDALVAEGGRVGFRRLVNALLLPHAKRLGWDEKKSDTESDRLLRQSVLGALALLSDEPWIATQAKLRARRFLDDPSSVDIATATIALKLGARRGELSFSELSARHAAATTPSVRIALVEALASFTDAPSLEKTLDLVRSGGIRAQDVVYLGRVAAETPAGRAVLVDWLATHLVEIIEKVPGFGVARMLGAVGRLCDAAQRSSAEQSLGAQLDKLGRSRRRLDEALETASLCLDLRDRQAAATTAYFKKNVRF